MFDVVVPIYVHIKSKNKYIKKICDKNELKKKNKKK